MSTPTCTSCHSPLPLMLGRGPVVCTRCGHANAPVEGAPPTRAPLMLDMPGPGSTVHRAAPHVPGMGPRR